MVPAQFLQVRLILPPPVGANVPVEVPIGGEQSVYTGIEEVEGDTGAVAGVEGFGGGVSDGVR